MYTAEDITRAAIQYLDICSEEQTAAGGRHMPPGSLARHNTYVFELIQLLLQYGLEPNAVYDCCNVLWELQYVDNGYIAADTLDLLLEHGGNGNMELDGEDLFSAVDFSIMLDAFNQKDRRRYDGLVHLWFVCLGYGGTPKNGTAAVETFRGFDLRNLRDHRRFTFGLSWVPGRGKTWSLHIFDRDILWEVARL